MSDIIIYDQWVFDSQTYDWRAEVDPETRDNLLGDGKDSDNPYEEWDRIMRDEGR